MKFGKTISITSLLLLGCSGGGDEVLRVTSPDGRLDGVVVESSAGATTSFLYIVCVVRRNEPCEPRSQAATLYGAARNPSAYGVNIRWADSFHLLVEYASAEKQHLIRSKPGGHDEIDVQLIPGVVDPTAPPGAMYRRDKRP